ncbi:hypothetical protein [Marinobacter alkaliphilus]|uniref:hypothetical protein n=1 Tax=Marinobacter alkaliphilus TaxID=254719 RepID=UPI003D769055
MTRAKITKTPDWVKARNGGNHQWCLFVPNANRGDHHPAYLVAQVSNDLEGLKAWAEFCGYLDVEVEK